MSHSEKKGTSKASDSSISFQPHSSVQMPLKAEKIKHYDYLFDNSCHGSMYRLCDRITANFPPIIVFSATKAMEDFNLLCDSVADLRTTRSFIEVEIYHVFSPGSYK